MARRFLQSDDDEAEDEDEYASLVRSAEAQIRRETPQPAPPPSRTPLSKTRFIVRADITSEATVRFGHHPHTEAIFRRHCGAQVFTRDGTFWDVPLVRYRSVVAALQSPANGFVAVLDAVPDSIFRAVVSLRPRATTPADLEVLPAKLLSGLFPHQRESVLFALSRGFRVFVADDMGLGKTIEAIACACVAGFPSKIKVLVLAPNNLVGGWVDGFLQWTNVWQSSINVVLKNERLADTPLTVVSFTAGMRMADRLKEMVFDMIIVDESHELKNHKTQTYQNLSPVIQRSRYLLMLSGTPTMNRPAELFPQLKLLLPSVFSSFKEYAVRYCKGCVDSFGRFECSGCTHSEELKVVLEYLVMIRRQKHEVLNDLPAKKRFHTKLDYVASADIRSMMKTIGLQRMSISAGMGSMKGEQSMVITRAFAQTAKEKLPAILNWFCSSEFRSAFLKEDRKCLIFAHHLNVLNGIHEWMTKQEVGSIIISGSTSRDQRECQLYKFRNDRECKVAVLSIEIASTGLTLTEASLVVFAELKWTPADHQQAEDRVHRIGQKRDVIVHYLHAEGSLDDRMWEILEKKLVMISSVISSSTTTFETDCDAK